MAKEISPPHIRPNGLTIAEELLLFPNRFPAQFLALWRPLPRLSIPQPQSTLAQTDGLEARSTHSLFFYSSSFWDQCDL